MSQIETATIIVPADEETQPTGLLYYKIHEAGPDKPWLVFIHGAGGSMVTWKHQLATFEPYYNLLLMDLRDHGKSKEVLPVHDDYDFEIVTDDILKVLDHLEINTAHFMSLSLGSIILQKLHERRPDLIASMIMAGGVFKADWKIYLFAHSGKFLSYLVPFRWIYDLFSLIVLPRKNHQPSRRLFRLQSQKLSQKEFLKWLGLYRDFFQVVRKFFRKRLETASLVVVGSQDHVFFRAACRFARKHAHLAQLAIIEQCGHICNIEKPKRFNEIVLHFLRELEAGRVAFPVNQT